MFVKSIWQLWITIDKCLKKVKVYLREKGTKIPNLKISLNLKEVNHVESNFCRRDFFVGGFVHQHARNRTGYP